MFSETKWGMRIRRTDRTFKTGRFAGGAALFAGAAVTAYALWWRKNPSACPYGLRFFVDAVPTGAATCLASSLPLSMKDVPIPGGGCNGTGSPSLRRYRAGVTGAWHQAWQKPWQRA